MTTYYFSNAGDDLTGDGLSDATAWATYAKALTITPALGDVFQFRGGDVFYTTGDWWVQNDLTASPVTITSYGTGKAILNTPTAGNTSAIRIRGSLTSGGLVVHDLIIRGGAQNIGTGISSYDKFVNLDVYNCDLVSLDIGITLGEGSNGIQNNFNIHDNLFNNCSNQGFLGGSNNLAVTSNVFLNCGWLYASVSHSMYISSKTYTSTVVDVTNNVVINSGRKDGAGSSSTAFVTHGFVDNLTINGNSFIQEQRQSLPAGYAIAVNNGDSVNDVFNNLIIKDNFIEGAGFIGIIIDSTNTATIENNTILSNGLVDGTNTIKGISVGLGPQTPQSNNIIVKNNIVYAIDDAGVSTQNDVVIEAGVVGQVNTNNQLVLYTPPLNFHPTKLPTKGYLSGVTPLGQFTYTNELGITPDSDSFSYKIHDSVGVSTEAVVNLSIFTGAANKPTLGALVLPAAETTIPYSFFVNTIQVGGSAPTSYTLVSGTMGSGLTFNTVTGEISGTPTVATSLTGLSFSATNSAGTSNTTNMDNLVITPHISVLTFNGVNSYADITPVSGLVTGDTITIDFKRTHDDWYVFSGGTSAGSHQIDFWFGYGKIYFSGGSLTVDGIPMVNNTANSDFQDGLWHTAILTIGDSNGRTISTVARNNVDNNNSKFYTNALRNLSVVKVGVETKYNIDSGSITTEAASVGTGTMTFNNVVATDWV